MYAMLILRNAAVKALVISIPTNCSCNGGFCKMTICATVHYASNMSIYCWVYCDLLRTAVTKYVFEHQDATIKSNTIHVVAISRQYDIALSVTAALCLHLLYN